MCLMTCGMRDGSKLSCNLLSAHIKGPRGGKGELDCFIRRTCENVEMAN